MTDTKPTKTRRPVTPARLHKAIVEFCDLYTIGVDAMVGELLDAIRDSWFLEAQKK